MKKNRLKISIAAVIACMPFNWLRVWMYRMLLRYDIDYDSHISMFNLIVCNDVFIRSSRIGLFNRIFCNSLAMDNMSWINHRNKITLLNKVKFMQESGLKNKNMIIGLYEDTYEYKENCNFYLGSKSLVTNQHIVDCTSSVTIGNNVVIAGNQTQIWTHGFDFNRKMIVKPVKIDDNIYIGSRCTIVGGVHICGNTNIAAATVVSKSITESGFYVSNKLELKKQYEYV